MAIHQFVENVDMNQSVLISRLQIRFNYMTIIELKEFKKNNTPLLTVKDENVSDHYCSHAFEIDIHQRIVNCYLCKKSFDSFDAIVYICRHWKIYSSQKKVMDQELSKKREELQELKRQINNHKSKIKRMEK